MWRTFAEGHVTVSEGGALATLTEQGRTFNDWSLTTTGTKLTEGKHYWEVELLSKNVTNIFIGISRPNLEPAGAYFHRNCNDGWFVNAHDGTLWGNGKQQADRAGPYELGDRVGVLLDLNDGSLHFFKNGVQHGPGSAAGRVTGPVVAAVQMFKEDSSLRLLTNAEAPANA
jgi:hypothetical protein